MKEVDIEEYKEFIKDLELNNIRTVESECKLSPTFKLPAEISIDEDSEYKNNRKSGSISVLYVLNIKAKQKGKKTYDMNIKAKYHLVYNTKIFLNDELFEHFKNNEVRIQLWPYFREYVNHMTYYMGLPPLILNLLKVKYGFKE